MSTSVPNYVLVPSYTQPDLYHRVNPKTGECDCDGQAIYGHNACRHSRLVLALVWPDRNRLDLLDDATLGMLADYRTPIITLQCYETDYQKKARDFEPGAWQHMLAFDSRTFICVSWHIDTEREVISDVLDVNTWHSHIPPTHHTREVKQQYRRPNYELSERPIKH